MYLVYYFYRIPYANKTTLVRLLQQANQIALRCGMEKYSLAEGHDLSPKYGCDSLGPAFDLQDDEALVCERDEFTDVKKYRQVMRLLDSDAEISSLHKQLLAILGTRPLFRSEFLEI